ncbi:MAG: YybH family protein [Gemmatimonadales bacterium]
MSMRSMITVLGLLLTTLQTAVEAQSATDTASVRAFYAAWFGPASQDPERYAGFYAPDGMVLPPNGMPVQGREAIAEWQRRTRAEATYSVVPEGIRVDEIRFLSPDLVIYRGSRWGKRIPKAGGDPVPFETKYFDLLQRPSGGEWKVSYRMGSDNR